METRLVRHYPFMSLLIASIGGAVGILIASFNFEDAPVLLGARVLYGVLGFMAAYALGSWYLSRRLS